ncbi:MAG: hypothetical protein ABJA82_09025 [Myxococcales bacterium]
MTSALGNRAAPLTGGCHGNPRSGVTPFVTDTLIWWLRTCIWVVGVGLTSVHATHAQAPSASRSEDGGPAPASDVERNAGKGERTTGGTGEKRTKMTSASYQRAERVRVRVDDPSVDVVCKAAVALALAEPERARAFLGRARLAGWLPEVHFRIYRRFARTEGLTFADTPVGGGTVAPVDISAVDDVRYEWRGSWDLSRMVFNPDELQAHFEALRMADVRRDIQSFVIKLYFERLRLLAEADPPARATGSSTDATSSSGTPAAEKLALRIAEIEAQLDALSGGAFSGGQSSRHPAAAASP